MSHPQAERLILGSNARETTGVVVDGWQRQSFLARVFAVAGFVLCFVAWTHSVLIWFPAHFGVPPWEFAAATQTIDVLPLAVAGITLMAAAAIISENRVGAVLLAVIGVLTALILSGLLVLIALNLLVAWRSVTSAMRESLGKTAVKAALFGVMFFVYHIWLSIKLLQFRKLLRRDI
jgi:hypothetical protein